MLVKRFRADLDSFWLLALLKYKENVKSNSWRLAGLLLPEHIPEPESFVPSARHDALSVRRHGQVENTVAVAGQLGHLGEAGIFPDQDLVLRVAVGRHQLTGVLRPGEVADLDSEGCRGEKDR